MSAPSSLHLRITTANAPTVMEPVDPADAERRFTDAWWDSWPTADNDAPAVAVELLLHPDETMPVRRRWMWASRLFTFVWDGDSHVGVSQADPTIHDDLSADDRFALEDPPPVDLHGFVALCQSWEQASADWVDILLGRQRLMPKGGQHDRYDAERDLTAGIPDDRVVGFRDEAREAAAVLEELAALLRIEPINTIASYRAWAVEANDLLLGLACRAEVLRSIAYTSRQPF